MSWDRSDEETFERWETARLERCIELELIPYHVKRLKRGLNEHPRDFIARYWADKDVMVQATADMNKALFGKEKGR